MLRFFSHKKTAVLSTVYPDFYYYLMLFLFLDYSLHTSIPILFLIGVGFHISNKNAIS